MATPQEMLSQKRKDVRLSLGDVFSENDDPTWRTKHPLGPVHVTITCVCCGAIVAEDLREYGWLSNESYVKAHLIPHFLIHVKEGA